MALILSGVAYDVPGLPIVSYADDARVPEQVTDRNARAWRDVQMVVVHTTSGRRGAVIEGELPSSRDFAFARYQASTPDHKSWHFTVDTDGSITQSLDPGPWAAWHASDNGVNNRSVGFELVQDGARLYTVQLEAAAKLVDVLTFAFGIQRQYPVLPNGAPDGGIIQRMRDGGESCWGVFGHRNVTPTRGWGDPGDPIFEVLRARGYEGWEFELGQDREIWSARQRDQLGVSPDGIPGAATVGALRAQGRPGGLWVVHPWEWPVPWAWGAVGVAAGVGLGWAGWRWWEARQRRAV